MYQSYPNVVLVCDTYEDQLNHYIDGELPFEAQPGLFSHLASCQKCRLYLEGLIAFRRMVSEETLLVPPSDDDAFLQRLAAHREAVVTVQQRAERRAKARAVLPLAGRVAAVALILVVVVGTFIQGQMDEPTWTGKVVGEEELVNFPAAGDANRDYGAVYVFYPGLTIEADNWVEPVVREPL